MSTKIDEILLIGIINHRNEDRTISSLTNATSSIGEYKGAQGMPTVSWFMPFSAIKLPENKLTDPRLGNPGVCSFS